MRSLPFIFLLILFQNYSFSQHKLDSASFYKSKDGFKIYYEAKGKGNAVVLIHGFTNTSQSWKKTNLYNDLISAGYKVVIPDLRGNGLSDKPHTEEAYLNDAEAKDVIGIVNELGIKNYSVIGYSRGAIIASRVLVLDKRVSKTVLGGMGSDFMNPQWPRRIMFYEALAGKRNVKELEGLIKRIKESGMDQLALALSQNGQPSTSKEEFAKVNSKVLVLCGDADADNGLAKDLAQNIPGAAYQTVSGNHNNTLRTVEFSKAVIEFLK